MNTPYWLNRTDVDLAKCEATTVGALRQRFQVSGDTDWDLDDTTPALVVPGWWTRQGAMLRHHADKPPEKAWRLALVPDEDGSLLHAVDLVLYERV